MNWSLAILHGEQALAALGLAGLIALIGVPVLLYIWLWRTKISEFKLTLAYLILMAILCGVYSSSSIEPDAMFSLTLSSLAFILSLPWSALLGWVLSAAFELELGDDGFAILMMVGAAINSVLLYLGAVKMRRLIEH